LKFLTLVKPGPVPPSVDLVRSAQDWIDAKISDGTFECVYAFLDGGGFSVGKADSLDQLMDDLLDYPLAPFVEYDVRPLIAVDDAFPKVIKAAERLTSADESQHSTAPRPTTSPPRQTFGYGG